MEHHSYAKIEAQNWSAEEKRLLVKKRIADNHLFAECSSKQSEPWKIFKETAKIGDYSAGALRSQWLDIIQQYRDLKSKETVTPLTKECIDKLNKEWEFFGEIDSYMNLKAKDLHSYAIKDTSITPEDTTEDKKNVKYVVKVAEFAKDELFAKTDRAVITRRVIPMPHNYLNRFEKDNSITIEDDVSDDSDDINDLSSLSTAAKIHLNLISGLDEACPDPRPYRATDQTGLAEITISESESGSDGSNYCQWRSQQILNNAGQPMTGATTTMPPPQYNNAGRPSLKRRRPSRSKREKYYKHRRQTDHRFEHFLCDLITVFAQVVDSSMPSLRMTAKVRQVFSNPVYRCSSSCDEGSSDSD